MLQKWHKKGGVLIISYEMFRNLSNFSVKKNIKNCDNEYADEFRYLLVNPGADLVICDEGHLIRNEKSKINLSLQQIKTGRRIILTGTPLQNNLLECNKLLLILKVLNERFIENIHLY